MSTLGWMLTQHKQLFSANRLYYFMIHTETSLLLFDNRACRIMQETEGFLRVLIQPGKPDSASIRTIFIQTWLLHQQLGICR